MRICQRQRKRRSFTYRFIGDGCHRPVFTSRLVDNIFNGKNTPYIVVGILGIAALGVKAFVEIMDHKYSVSVEEGETSVSFAPQKN